MKGDGRTEYAVPVERFVEVWQSALTIKEVSDTLGIDPSILFARASQYRQMGIKLKKHKRIAANKIDVEKVNSLIEEINSKLEEQGIKVDVPTKQEVATEFPMSARKRKELLDDLLGRTRKMGKYIR